MPTRTRSTSGYTLIELLVSMLLSGIVLGVAATDFTHTVHQRHHMEQVAEAQQAVNAAMAFVTQELRQAGACLPGVGKFIAIDGENGRLRDTLVLRIGVLAPETMTCIRTVSMGNAAAGDSMLLVQSTDGFEPGQYIYISRTGGEGSTFTIASVDPGSITIDGVLDAPHTVGSGVYAIEERRYYVDDSSGRGVLMIGIDDADPVPLAIGIDEFNVSYRLSSCLECDSVDLPADNEEWRLVREVEISVASKTKHPLQSGDYHVVEQSTTVKPRNLI